MNDAEKKIERRINHIFGIVAKNFIGRKISVPEIVTMAEIAMELVEEYDDLSGPQKKAITIAVLIKIVDETDIVPAEYEEAALNFIETTLPIVIDTVVGAFNQVIKLKNHGSNTTKCSCW